MSNDPWWRNPNIVVPSLVGLLTAVIGPLVAVALTGSATVKPPPQPPTSTAPYTSTPTPTRTRTPSPSPSPVRTTATARPPCTVGTASPSLDTDQAAICTLLRSSLIDRRSCHSRPDLESVAPWNALSAITCETAADSTKVQLLRYRTVADMNAYLDRAAGSVNGLGNCKDGQESNTTWHTSSSGTLGRKVCIFLSNGKFQINWAFNTERVVVVREDQSAVSAASWWDKNACLLTSC
ncbi:hypothetical protein [Protofrankia coriariae]|uniref:hypothetical protein n=1 Tax=Protofrankia coriariae TaxID=1562887 RepID=UPI000A83AE6F|nr:hypothetical protein [Protofrankia coriariae]